MRMLPIALLIAAGVVRGEDKPSDAVRVAFQRVGQTSATTSTAELLVSNEGTKAVTLLNPKHPARVRDVSRCQISLSTSVALLEDDYSFSPELMPLKPGAQVELKWEIPISASDETCKQWAVVAEIAYLTEPVVSDLKLGTSQDSKRFVTEHERIVRASATLQARQIGKSSR